MSLIHVEVFKDGEDWIARCIDGDLLPLRTEVQTWGESKLEAEMFLRDALRDFGLIYGSEAFFIEERISE